MRNIALFIRALLLSCFLAVPLSAESGEEFFDFSLEELMDVEVTSLGKTEQKIGETPAIVHVLTSEDIRRSNATSIPQLLKLLPGVHVAQVSNTEWAISVRGFNNSLSNKLLVLVDGRSIYSNLFSGVFWNSIDTLLEDISRIELISGPGTAVWGANAVNGVINIVTKNASETNSTLASTWVGNKIRYGAQARQGAELSESTSARVYAKVQDRRALRDNQSGSADDSYRDFRFGGRVDSNLDDGTELSFIANGRTYDFRQRFLINDLAAFPEPLILNSDNDNYGFDVSFSAQKELSEELNFRFNSSYDHAEREGVGFPRYQTDTFDTETGLLWTPSDALTLNSGLSWRHYRADLEDAPAISFDWTGESEDFNIYSAFVYGEYDLIPNKLKLFGGLKIEYNDYTGSETMPSGRIAYYPAQDHTLWAGVAKGVRVPSIIDIRGEASRFLGRFDPGSGLPIFTDFNAGANIQAEELLTYEIGYRTQISDKVNFDINAYYSDYKDLQALSSEADPFLGFNNGLPVIFTPLRSTNFASAETWGVQVSAQAQLQESTRLTVSWDYTDISFQAPLGSFVLYGDGGSDPANIVRARLAQDFGDNIELDLFYYFIDRITTGDLEAAHQFDLRVAYRATEDITLSFVMNNLFDNGVQEFPDDTNLAVQASEIPRTFFGRIDFALD